MQKIETSEARIDTFHQQSRLSGSSSKGDDGGNTTKIYQAKPTLATTEEVREPDMNVSRLFVQTASDLPNTKGSPSLQLRTEADPSVSCMLDGAATMGRPHQGLFHFLSWQQCALTAWEKLKVNGSAYIRVTLELSSCQELVPYAFLKLFLLQINHLFPLVVHAQS